MERQEWKETGQAEKKEKRIHVEIPLKRVKIPLESREKALDGMRKCIRDSFPAA